MGQPALETAHANRGEGALAARVDLFSWDAHMEGPKGDVFENGEAEELVVRVLEEHSNLGSDPSEVLFCYAQASN